NADVRVAITAPVTQHVLFGQPLAFDVQAATADSSIATIAAPVLPAGATFTDHRDNRGTFQGTPGFDRIGTHTPVPFSATATGGLVDSTSTDVRVDGLTSFTFQSDPGDYIGGGQSLSLTPPEAQFSASSNRNHVGISINSPTHFWFIDFQA